MSGKSVRIIGISLLLFVLITITVSADSLQIVFTENFDDGELDNNPTWTYTTTAWEIIDGKLHSDGLMQDSSGRYRTLFDTTTSIEVENDYLEMSYYGTLKSVGNPQPGVSTVIALINHDVPAGYDLNIQNGYAHGFPTNQHSISFAYRANNTFYDLIVSDFVPNYDQEYFVKAIREEGVWSLYADGVLIGTAADPGGLTEFDTVHMPLAGSVIMDDILVKTSSDIIDVVIDIKPGNAQNPVNPKSNGRLSVAILSTDEINVSVIDSDSVRFGVNGDEASPVHVVFEDVDGDGINDMILQFNTQDTGVVCGDTSLNLTGSTFTGIGIQGSDSIQTVSCH